MPDIGYGDVGDDRSWMNYIGANKRWRGRRRADTDRPQ